MLFLDMPAHSFQAALVLVLSCPLKDLGLGNWLSALFLQCWQVLSCLGNFYRIHEVCHFEACPVLLKKPLRVCCSSFKKATEQPLLRYPLVEMFIYSVDGII